MRIHEQRDELRKKAVMYFNWLFDHQSNWTTVLDEIDTILLHLPPNKVIGFLNRYNTLIKEENITHE